MCVCVCTLQVLAGRQAERARKLVPGRIFYACVQASIDRSYVLE